MIRVSSDVCASCASSNPGAMRATSCGREQEHDGRQERPAPPGISVDTVDTTRHARASSSVASSEAMTGISADERAPAATSWNRRSGIRNAAQNGSRSADGPARSRAIAIVRT